jgi:hypothetical protein
VFFFSNPEYYLWTRLWFVHRSRLVCLVPRRVPPNFLPRLPCPSNTSIRQRISCSWPTNWSSSLFVLPTRPRGRGTH